MSFEGLTLQTSGIEYEHVVLLTIGIASLLHTIHKQRILVLSEVICKLYSSFWCCFFTLRIGTRSNRSFPWGVMSHGSEELFLIHHTLQRFVLDSESEREKCIVHSITTLHTVSTLWLWSWKMHYRTTNVIALSNLLIRKRTMKWSMSILIGLPIVDSFGRIDTMDEVVIERGTEMWTRWLWRHLDRESRCNRKRVRKGGKEEGCSFHSKQNG